MKRLCRQLSTSFRHAPKLWQELLPHARVITDPKRLAQLHADLASRKRKEEAEAKASY